ncbi:MAG: hypothetical protein JO370_09445 [Paucibacter sp.]|nr:hypothetical protein [Roseateles sp.]
MRKELRAGLMCLAFVAQPLRALADTAPSISVLGAFFPDWMFCGLGALLVTVPLAQVLAGSAWGQALGARWRLALNIAAFALLAMVGWLLWFKN